MKIMSLLLIWTVTVSLSACSAFTAPKEKPVIEDKLGITKNIGTLAITAERRVILVNSDHGGMFCAEPSPDVAESITSSLRAAAEASLKHADAEKVAAGLNIAKELSTSVNTLFVRSQGIQYLRDALYSLCQARMNQAFEKNDIGYVQRLDAILNNSKELISEELKQIRDQQLSIAVTKAQDASSQARQAAAVGEASARAAKAEREKAEIAAEAIKALRK